LYGERASPYPILITLVDHSRPFAGRLATPEILQTKGFTKTQRRRSNERPNVLPYNRHVNAHVIANSVPTPEEMGEILGVSADRVKTIRAIMSRPVQAKGPAASGRTRGKAPARKAVRQQARRVAPKT